MSVFLGLELPADPTAGPGGRSTDATADPATAGQGGTSSRLRPQRARRTPATAFLANPLIMDDDAPCPENQTMFQGFEWYVPADGRHWRRLAAAVPALAALGVTSMWIPPACKASRPDGNGYDIYDLYDLGEFDQKGARATKWGTKAELTALTHEACAAGIGVLFDAVLNHKAAADYPERAVATRVDPADRTRDAGPPAPIEAWTGFNFPGRGGAHSAMHWNCEHFTGIDYDHATGQKGVWRFEGKTWAPDVDEERGNYDYLMFADVDHRHPEVRADLFRWPGWLASELPLAGLRLDAVKHYSFEFLREFCERAVDPAWFLVGEYWREDSEFLARYVEYMRHRVSLFDVQLVANLSRISLLSDRGDLRQVFDDTLVVWKPDNAVTFVVNHDTVPLSFPSPPWATAMAFLLTQGSKKGNPWR